MKHNVRKTVLILGGTAEAADIAREWAARPGIRTISSLAGRTKNPAPTKGETRIGGFGGVDGLVQYIRDEKVDLLIDATHPFAKVISKNARAAASISNIDFSKLDRDPWQSQEGDNWQYVNSPDDAARALPTGARVFLALGSQHISAFEMCKDVYFIVRMVDAPDKPLALAKYQIVTGLPGADAGLEAALFRKFAISHLVCRNSGGPRGYPKLEAARTLELPVIMIKRPEII